MRFKIRNELRGFDYRRLDEFLRDNPKESIMLTPSFNDLPFMSVEPLMIRRTQHGYILATEIFLENPLSADSLRDLKSMAFDAKIEKCLDIGRADIKFEKTVNEPKDLESELNFSLRTLERIVNHVCLWSSEAVDFTLTLSSSWLDKQYRLKESEEETRKRGEAPEPYGVIHANGTRDAENLAGNLVPVYVGRDKAYLYEAKKLFRLLPRDFVRRLFALTGPSMTSEKEFSKEERQVLDEFVKWGYLKKRMVMKIVHYCDLDSRTQRLLLASLHRQKRTQID